MDSLELATYGAGGLFWGRKDPQTLSRPIEDLRGHVGVEGHRVTVEKVRFDYVGTPTDLVAARHEPEGFATSRMACHSAGRSDAWGSERLADDMIVYDG